MIVNAAVQELLNCKPGDEIVVASQEDYFRGYGLNNDLSPTKTPVRYEKVVDIVKENGKLIILI